MLDLFLETVCERTKVAQASEQLMRRLEKLPTAELQKIASYGLPNTKIGEDAGCWLEKFKGTPLFEEAIAIEKEELEVQTSEMERRRAQIEMDANVPRWDETDLHRQELSIRRKMLELELAGADVSSPADAELDEDPAVAPASPEEELAAGVAAPDGPPEAAFGGQEGEDAAPPPPKADAGPPAAKAEGAGGPPPPPAAEGGEDGPPPPKDDAGGPPAAKAEGGEEKPKPKPPTTKVTKETVEKPAEEKIDIKAAAARMRLARIVKEASPAARVASFRR